jgi:hypothetical protein
MSEYPTDLLQFLLDLEALQSTIKGNTPAPAIPSALAGGTDEPVTPAFPTSDPKPQKRCGACKHKLLLSDMACRCGIRHCSAHRLPETHSCTFDHRRQDRKVLEAQLVKCVADKLGEDRV